MPLADIGFSSQSLGLTSYNVRGAPKRLQRLLPDIAGSLEVVREHHFQYDDLDRLLEMTTVSDPNGAGPDVGALERTFTYDEYDPENRLLQKTGPDGQVTTYTYDELGRLKTATRNAGPNAMTAELTYDDAGRVSSVEYGNGAYTAYYYDEANRIVSIQHKEGINLLLGIDYTWTVNNWVSQRVETTPTGVATVDFEYDNRGRLIHETRDFDDGMTITTTYDLSYEYDQLGNRLRKIDAVAELQTEYHYDVDDPEAACELEYPTWHNRLLSYDIYDTSEEPMEHLREVRYTYYKTGQASNITIKDDAGDPNAVDWYYDLSLTYWRHGPLRYALWGRWLNDPNDHPIEESYEPLSAREFRFDTSRGRYMMVDLDTNNSDVPTNWTAAGPMKWTDYEGDTPYGDFDVALNSPWATTATTNYFGLSGHQTLDPNEHVAETRYWHEDLIGSTSLTTDEMGGAGVPPADMAYTAFGERLTAGGIPGGEAPAGSPRYQYAGAYGYESDLLTLQGANPNLAPITLQHLGHRWYQPDLGRFVQRDPIGIAGGLNVYLYTMAAPLDAVDPFGLTSEHGEFIEKISVLMGQLMGRIARSPEGYKNFWKFLLKKAAEARNAAFFDRYGPLAIGLTCVHYDLIVPALDAAHDYVERTKGVDGKINRTRHGRMGGFSPSDPDELWGY